MSGLLIGMSIGIFIGIGCTLLCLFNDYEHAFVNHKHALVRAETWIDEAFEKAIRSTKQKR